MKNPKEIIYIYYIVELDCIPTHHNIGRMSNISRNCLRPEVNRQSKQPVYIIYILYAIKRVCTKHYTLYVNMNIYVCQST